MTNNKKGRTRKIAKKSRSTAEHKPTGKSPTQKTLPDMFTRGPGKRKQEVDEWEAIEHVYSGSWAAKKVPEPAALPSSFLNCFRQPVPVSSGFHAFYHLQSSSSFMGESFAGHSFQRSQNDINCVYTGTGSLAYASQSSLSVSANRNRDLELGVNAKFRSRHQPYPKQIRTSLPPLPNVAWADSKDLWNLMCWKDTVYSRDPHYFHRHPSIQPRMRAILLDWISEVCEVYKLHRETYHLTVDFIDRYLSQDQDVPKQKLQLVGVTALFIAAKLEEIYPPKCSEFATVTDGACDESDIRDQEVIMLKRLNWALSPVTPNNWLTVYLQLLQRECDVQLKPRAGFRRGNPQELVVPKFNRHSFLQLSRLVDLCLLDPGSVRFQYGVVAASAMCSLFEPEQAVLRVSGFKYEDLGTCVDWMRPFTESVKELNEVQMRIFQDIQEEDHHNIQTHEFDLALLDRAEFHQRELQKYRLSPDYQVNGASLSAIFPTPPQSDERPPMHLTRLPPYSLP